MSAGLLLRLFQSEHFNVHLAVSYLRTYKDSVGITYYIAHKLAQEDEDELQFYWPQLCHLVVSHSSESGALESFIITKCEESIHLSMLTLWQMQASLSDLSSKPNTASFATCRRLYNRAQHIIFGDALLESTADACQARRRLRSQRIKPALVGVGIVLAAVALPQLATFEGQIAIEEGRKGGDTHSSEFMIMDSPSMSDPEDSDKEDSATARSLTVSKRSVNGGQGSTFGQSLKASVTQMSNNLSKTNRTKVERPAQSPSYLPGAPLTLANPSGQLAPPFHRASSGKPLRELALRKSSTVSTPPLYLTSPSERIGHAHSMVDLPTSGPQHAANGFTSTRKQSSQSLRPVSTDDTQSWNGNESPVSRSAGYAPKSSLKKSNSKPPLKASHTPLGSPRLASSTPSFHPYSASTNNLSNAGISGANTIPPETLSLLLRSYACRSQLDLITSLQDIATRLILVPKLARVSALRAELTVLNHGLPRGCCLCLGCAGQGTGSLVSTDSRSKSDSLLASAKSIFSRSPNSDRKRAHHRIVRISPSESVVLNSADRAPFLIHVEILEGDLDFDPSRRQNAEDIRSVLAEREGKISKTRSTSVEGMQVSETAASQDPQRSPTNELAEIQYSPANSSSDDRNAKRFPREAEESGDIGSSAPVEEEVDLVEQMYGTFSVHDAASEPLPQYHPQIHNRSVEEKAWQRAENRKSLHARTASQESQSAGSSSTSPTSQRYRKPLTIDEYAERMRMAAIMLTQLNASQQAPMTGTDAVTGVVGAAVGTGVNLTYGVGSVVGSVMGVGVDAVKASFGSRRRSSIVAADASSIGQAAAGVAAPVDSTTAVAGLSNVSGVANPANLPETARTQASPGYVNAANGPGSPVNSGSTHPRQRVLSAQEAANIRERIMKEMMALEEERMARMKALTRSSRVPMLAANAPAETTEEETIVMRAINKDDPSGSVLSESWNEKKSRIRKGSPYGHLLSWDVFSVIVKTGADLRQEQLAVQLIKEFGRIWTETKSPHWVRFFRILVTSESTGLMETITDAVSVHSIKKEAYSKLAALDTAQAGYLPSYTLYDHFQAEFGAPDSPRFRKAQDAFMKSLASYSVITYLLQIKDRHNGNILVDKAGHLMHIDFGFMLSNSPGSLGFEMAPFKLTQDYVDILGGVEGKKFLEFRTLLKRLFKDVRSHAERIITLVESMQADSKLPCFDNGVATIQQLRDRFQLSMSVPQLDEHVDRLVISSAGSAFTRLYDTFQRHSQGVL